MQPINASVEPSTVLLTELWTDARQISGDPRRYVTRPRHCSTSSIKWAQYTRLLQNARQIIIIIIIIIKEIYMYDTHAVNSRVPDRLNLLVLRVSMPPSVDRSGGIMFSPCPSGCACVHHWAQTSKVSYTTNHFACNFAKCSPILNFFFRQQIEW